MAKLSDFDSFAAGWARGENQIVFARLAADLTTPVSAMLKLPDARFSPKAGSTCPLTCPPPPRASSAIWATT